MTEYLRTRVAELEELNTRLAEQLKEAQFRPLGDNHHNAAACPYCSPKIETNTPLLGVVTAARLFVEAQNAATADENYHGKSRKTERAYELYRSLAYAVAALPSESQPAPAPGVDVTAADKQTIRQLQHGSHERVSWNGRIYTSCAACVQADSPKGGTP